MPTLEQLKLFFLGTILPPLVGVVAAWLIANVHVLNLFHITESSVVGELTLLGTWGLSALFAYLTSHHILSGHWDSRSRTTR